MSAVQQRQQWRLQKRRQRRRRAAGVIALQIDEIDENDFAEALHRAGLISLGQAEQMRRFELEAFASRIVREFIRRFRSK